MPWSPAAGSTPQDFLRIGLGNVQDAGRWEVSSVGCPCLELENNGDIGAAWLSGAPVGVEERNSQIRAQRFPSHWFTPLMRSASQSPVGVATAPPCCPAGSTAGTRTWQPADRGPGCPPPTDHRCTRHLLHRLVPVVSAVCLSPMLEPFGCQKEATVGHRALPRGLPPRTLHSEAAPSPPSSPLCCGCWGPVDRVAGAPPTRKPGFICRKVGTEAVSLRCGSAWCSPLRFRARRPWLLRRELSTLPPFHSRCTGDELTHSSRDKSRSSHGSAEGGASWWLGGCERADVHGRARNWAPRCGTGRAPVQLREAGTPSGVSLPVISGLGWCLVLWPNYHSAL